MKINFKTPSLSDEDKIKLSELQKDFPSLSKVVLRAFYSRGLKNKESIEYAINANLSDITFAYDMKDAKEFIAYLIDAKVKNKKVVIMGDYDTDGSVGTSIAMLSLLRLGMDVDFYQNDRFVDGYGLKPESVRVIKEKFPNVDVIITVDNGISAFDGIDYANSLGIDVLVTDHHRAEEVLPNAKLIVNPKRLDCPSKEKNLCGAAVIWKLMYTLFRELNEDLSFVINLLDLVAIATIGDLMPLIGENRVLVKEGLKLLNQKNRLSTSTLVDIVSEKFGIKDTCVNVDTIGFYLSPLINAVSRLEGNPSLVVNMLISNDDYFIRESANKMLEINDKRKKMTDSQVSTAYDLVDNFDKDAYLHGEPNHNYYVIYHESFTEGIIGLVAGRVTEKFNRPCLVLCDGPNGTLKGSARSVKPVDIYDCLNKSSDLLEGYGGHEFAAGFTIKKENLDKLNSRFSLLLSDLDESSFYKEVLIDSIIRPEDLELNLCTEFDILEPCGNGFRKPRYLMKDFVIDIPKTNANKCGSPFVGKDGKTLRLVNYQNKVVMMFKYSDKYRELNYPNKVWCVGSPQLNEFKGIKSVQFLIENDYLLKM